MALLAALCAVVRGDIARAEPASCARETDRFAIVPFRFVQHDFGEHVSLQHVVASVAALSFSVPLALDAVFCLVVEGSYIFDLATLFRQLSLRIVHSQGALQVQSSHAEPDSARS